MPDLICQLRDLDARRLAHIEIAAKLYARRKWTRAVLEDAKDSMNCAAYLARLMVKLHPMCFEILDGEISLQPVEPVPEPSSGVRTDNAYARRPGRTYAEKMRNSIF